MSTSASGSATLNMYEAQLPIAYGVYVALASAVYEHAITLEFEYEFLWQRKWTAATWLFIANRYSLLACVISQSAPYSAQSVIHAADATIHPYSLCRHVVYARTLIIPAQVFSALRVFALLGYAYLPAGCVFLLGMTQVAINLYESAHAVYSYVDDPLFGASCFPSSLLSVSTRLQSVLPSLIQHCLIDKLGLSLTLTTIASDVIALITTWVTTYQHIRQAASVNVPTSFSLALIEYGTLYFIAICAMNVLSLVKIFTPFSGLLVGDTTGFIFTLPNILLSRFLINVGHAEHLAPSTVSRFSQFSAPNFRVPSLPGDQEDEEYRCEAAFCQECSNQPDPREYRNPRESDGDKSGTWHAVGDSSDPPEVRTLRYGQSPKSDAFSSLERCRLHPNSQHR
ncbi:hypothetical protein NM688_g3811 [Phlebia brevispora]|uniref:Uncharacterized protein n=1 Tax=Phlebia brevispora TaxID=194682 RepID=A0ACC1T4F7_9APHY|nr:hypothetical protein NM688_g3811 [Phlebia brevispora]